MTGKRFKRYLFDGGFSFGEEYIPPKWSISDENTRGSPFGFLEFDDEHKDLCDEIVDSLNEFVEEYNHLKKENEQLKKETYELHKRLGDFEPFEEHMKEKTSKTSVNDIIGLVKTNEPTNSVELKKELYK